MSDDRVARNCASIPALSRKVDVALVSGRKCASRYLMTLLSSHPQAFVITAEQFLPDLESNKMKVVDISKDSLGRPFDNQPVILARRNMKGLNSRAAEIFKSYNPELKFFGFIRDPVERTFSNYIQLHFEYMRGKKRSGYEEMEDVRRRLMGRIYDINLDLDKRDLEHTFDNIDQSDFSSVQEYYLNSLYYYLYSRFYELFPKENLMIMPIEVFANDPDKYIGVILNFMGLDPDFRLENIHLEVGKSEGIIATSHWFSFVPKLRFAPMNTKTIARLKNLYRDDAQEMGELIGYDLVSLYNLTD